jgi:MGT family glycosyltransferase
MKVLLTSHGSTGDIYPFIALGAELKNQGHDVSFATAQLFEKEITDAGLNFIDLPPDWGQDKFNEAMLMLTKARTAIQTLQVIYKHTLPYVDDVIKILEREIQCHDVIVSSYLFPHYRIIAERFNRPFAIVTFCHNVVPSEGAPPPHPISKIPFPKFLRKYWVRVNWRLSNKVVDSAINRVVGKSFKKIGIPQIKDFLIQPAELSMVSVSKALFEPNYKFSKNFEFVGYMRWQSQSQPGVVDKVKAFIGDDRVPVLTFGSVTFKNKDEIVRRFLSAWPKDRKIIVQKGWVDMSVAEDNENILNIGSMAHDDLFPLASVVIHHGGAGTTSTGLHAGVPQIVIPHIGDQPFWSREVRKLGVGKRLSRRNWPEKLPEMVAKVEQNIEMNERCRTVGKILSDEDGPKNASIALEAFVKRHHEKLVSAEELSSD